MEMKKELSWLKEGGGAELGGTLMKKRIKLNEEWVAKGNGKTKYKEGWKGGGEVRNLAKIGRGRRQKGVDKQGTQE